MDFITLKTEAFEIGEIPENLIFTSQNSVKAILDHPSKKELQQKNIFCVGEKTAEFLKAEGFKIKKIRDYGRELASEILENHSSEKFLFFCGKKRHDALPETLKNAGVAFSEVKVYDTLPRPRKIDRIFDGVLFFSPSAVKSYCMENDLSKSIAFCIGTTTSAEAEKHTKKIVIASKPSVENVVAQVVKYFKL